jgi:hypothetical protein
VQSWKSFRDLHVVKQKRDYSCGAAALATLTRYYWGDGGTELEYLTISENLLTPEELEDRVENGLSLTDLSTIRKLERNDRELAFLRRHSSAACRKDPTQPKHHCRFAHRVRQLGLGKRSPIATNTAHNAPHFFILNSLRRKGNRRIVRLRYRRRILPFRYALDKCRSFSGRRICCVLVTRIICPPCKISSLARSVSEGDHQPTRARNERARRKRTRFKVSACWGVNEPSRSPSLTLRARNARAGPATRIWVDGRS